MSRPRKAGNEILTKEENLGEVEFENNSSHEAAMDEDAEGFTDQPNALPILEVQDFKKEDYIKEEITDFGEPPEHTDYPKSVDMLSVNVKEEMFDPNKNSDNPLTFKNEEVNQAESEEKNHTSENVVHLTDQNMKLEQEENSDGIYKGCESVYKTGSASGFIDAEVDCTKMDMISKAKGHQGKEEVEYLPNQDGNEKEANKEKQCLPNLDKELAMEYDEFCKEFWSLSDGGHIPTDNEVFEGFTDDENRLSAYKYQMWLSLMFGLHPNSRDEHCCLRHMWEESRIKGRSSKVYYCQRCDHSEVTLFALALHERARHGVKIYKCNLKTECEFTTDSLEDYIYHCISHSETSSEA